MEVWCLISFSYENQNIFPNSQFNYILFWLTIWHKKKNLNLTNPVKHNSLLMFKNICYSMFCILLPPKFNVLKKKKKKKKKKSNYKKKGGGRKKGSGRGRSTCNQFYGALWNLSFYTLLFFMLSFTVKIDPSRLLIIKDEEYEVCPCK